MESAQQPPPMRALEANGLFCSSLLFPWASKPNSRGKTLTAGELYHHVAPVFAIILLSVKLLLCDFLFLPSAQWSECTHLYYQETILRWFSFSFALKCTQIPWPAQVWGTAPARIQGHVLAHSEKGCLCTPYPSGAERQADQHAPQVTGGEETGEESKPVLSRTVTHRASVSASTGSLTTDNGKITLHKAAWLSDMRFIFFLVKLLDQSCQYMLHSMPPL